jgi:predicted acyl esterase
MLPEHVITLLKSSILVGSLTGQGGAAEALRSASGWQPDAPKYEFELTKNLGVQMDDGVHLRADVYFPVDPVTRKRAPGMAKIGSERGPRTPQSILSVAVTFLRSQICVDSETRRAKRRGLVHAWGETVPNWWTGRRVLVAQAARSA